MDEQKGKEAMAKKSVTIRKTYKYRLYSSKRDERLLEQLNIAGIIWNHITALQKRDYRLFGKQISEKRMKRHIAKLRIGARWDPRPSKIVVNVMRTSMPSFSRNKGGAAVQESQEVS